MWHWHDQPNKVKKLENEKLIMVASCFWSLENMSTYKRSKNRVSVWGNSRLTSVVLNGGELWMLTLSFSELGDSNFKDAVWKFEVFIFLGTGDNRNIY